VSISRDSREAEGAPVAPQFLHLHRNNASCYGLLLLSRQPLRISTSPAPRCPSTRQYSARVPSAPARPSGGPARTWLGNAEGDVSPWMIRAPRQHRDASSAPGTFRSLSATVSTCRSWRKCAVHTPILLPLEARARSGRHRSPLRPF
jgi:hypothetical protein